MAKCKKCKTNYGYYESPGLCGKCYDLHFQQKEQRTTQEKLQIANININKRKHLKKPITHKTKTVHYTYNKWLDLGYQVQIGEHATHWNKNGISTFTQKQVKKS